MGWIDPTLCDYKFGQHDQCNYYAIKLSIPCSIHIDIDHNRCEKHKELACNSLDGLTETLHDLLKDDIPVSLRNREGMQLLAKAVVEKLATKGISVNDP